jgi:hypothetical protein
VTPPLSSPFSRMSRECEPLIRLSRCARRSDRPTRRRASLRASVSSDRSAQVLGGSSPFGGRLVEAALFQIPDQRRVYQLRHVGPAKLPPRSTQSRQFGQPLTVNAVGRGSSRAALSLACAIVPVSVSSLLNHVQDLVRAQVSKLRIWERLGTPENHTKGARWTFYNAFAARSKKRQLQVFSGISLLLKEI